MIMQAIIITMSLHLADNVGWTDMRPIKNGEFLGNLRETAS